MGDAKFETLVRRESRISLIEAAKELAIAGGEIYEQDSRLKSSSLPEVRSISKNERS